MGRGAWEIATRWDYLNLNDGPIKGGVVDGCEVALNWYLNPNVKIQFEYMDNNRFHLNPAGTPVGKTDGVVQGFGTRLQAELLMTDARLARRTSEDLSLARRADMAREGVHGR